MITNSTDPDVIPHSVALILVYTFFKKKMSHLWDAKIFFVRYSFIHCEKRSSAIHLGENYSKFSFWELYRRIYDRKFSLTVFGDGC